MFSIFKSTRSYIKQFNFNQNVNYFNQFRYISTQNTSIKFLAKNAKLTTAKNFHNRVDYEKFEYDRDYEKFKRETDEKIKNLHDFKIYSSEKLDSYNTQIKEIYYFGRFSFVIYILGGLIIFILYDNNTMLKEDIKKILTYNNINEEYTDIIIKLNKIYDELCKNHNMNEEILKLLENNAIELCRFLSFIQRNANYIDTRRVKKQFRYIKTLTSSLMQFDKSDSIITLHIEINKFVETNYQYNPLF